jgi:proline racemase
VKHPERPEVCTVDVTEFYEDDLVTKSGKGVVIYGESNLDRSPCGTGTAAKMTLLSHHNGKLEPGQVYTNASPLGTTFEGRIIKKTIIGGLKA